MIAETQLFPGLFDESAKNSRSIDIERHLESLRACWPEWTGPKVGEICDVHGPIAYSLTHGAPRYHMSAPVRITKAIPGGEVFLGRVEYDADSVCAHLNGEELQLDILEIWAPVGRLCAARRAKREGCN